MSTAAIIVIVLVVVLVIAAIAIISRRNRARDAMGAAQLDAKREDAGFHRDRATETQNEAARTQNEAALAEEKARRLEAEAAVFQGPLVAQDVQGVTLRVIGAPDLSVPRIFRASRLFLCLSTTTRTTASEGRMVMGGRDCRLTLPATPREDFRHLFALT